MRSVGDSHDTIARALGIDDDTLRKHFPEELLNGAAKKRRQAVDMVFKGAKGGNASLIKRLEEMTRASSADVGDDEQSRPKAQKLGKKEAQRQEAIGAGAGTEWGDDLAPLSTSDRLN